MLSLLLMATACSVAQSFGRFGYGDIPTVPGFVIEKDGFRARSDAADRFYFPAAAPEWKISSVSEFEANIDLGKGAGPTALNINLLSPGFMLNFPSGFELKFRSTSSPFLSWREASVGEHVPTPSVRWIAVSFKDRQPPVVLGFLDGAVSLQIEGNVGDWSLKTTQPYKGWVRVALPLGTTPFATTDAAALGQLSNAVDAGKDVWWQPVPKLRSLKIEDEDTAVQATWQFDRPGVIVPVAATMAPIGRYPLTILSKVHRLGGSTEEGPLTICDDSALTIRFPVGRVPLGRAITIGSPVIEPIGTVSALDVSGVVELALENLLSSRDLRSRQTAESTVHDFIRDAQYVTEPHTNQQLPFAPNGSGLDVVAANALLYQAYTMSTTPSSRDNSLLTSVGWRRDWYTWKIWTDDAKQARRAGALAGLAGAFCSEPQRRLEGAMLQAGLAAERGLGIYLARAAGRVDEPTYLEPLWEIRNTVFKMVQTPRHPSPFAESLYSDLRVFGDDSVRCSSDPEKGLTVEWSDAMKITLASGFPMQAQGDRLETKHLLGYTMITAPNLGPQTAQLIIPSWAPPLPAFVAPPRYSEPVN